MGLQTVTVEEVVSMGPVELRKERRYTLRHLLPRDWYVVGKTLEGPFDIGPFTFTTARAWAREYVKNGAI